MKVWYIVMTFPSPTETFVANDVRALRRLGIDVSVHALRGRRGDAEQLLRERGLASLVVTHGTTASAVCGFISALRHPLRVVGLIWWLARHSGARPVHLVKGLALLPRIFNLFDRLERDRPDVVHLYWGHYPSIFGWLVLQQAPDVVVSLSLSAYDLLRGFPGSGTVAKKAHLVSSWAAANVGAIASQGVAADAVYVCRQGVDLENVKHRRFEKIPRRLVTAGRLITTKGMDDVLRAFASLRSKYPDASLVVLGEGADRRRLEDLASDLRINQALSFRGHIAHEEVFEELAQAEIFLLLSRDPDERLPNVVKEAMACRCFVITTDTPGIDELIDDGVHGRVVAQGAWEAAAECAAAALANRTAMEKTAVAAHHQVIDRFDLVRQMEGMLRKWEECCGRIRRETTARALKLPSPAHSGTRIC
jgi:colanic acid/amylovoran biosynthesis glycosyltransferase